MVDQIVDGMTHIDAFGLFHQQHSLIVFHGSLDLFETENNIIETFLRICWWIFFGKLLNVVGKQQDFKLNLCSVELSPLIEWDVSYEDLQFALVLLKIT